MGERASGEGDQAQKRAAVPVEVAAIKRGAIEEVVESSTDLEAEEEVKVYARTSNRVAELLVEEGDAVEKGQVLLRLEDDHQRTQVDKAQAQLKKVQQEFARQQALHEQNLISDQTYEETQFQLDQLKLTLADAERELEYTSVIAPIAGKVTQRLVKYGDLVRVNQHLFDIIDFDSIVARVYLPEKNLGALSVGQTVRVTAPALGDREYDGYVRRIAPTVERKTGTVKVTVAFKDVGELLPGMYVKTVIVTSTREDALLLSKRSLVYDGDQIFVFRLTDDRTVERVLVERKLTDEFNVEPVKGFEEGDLIVIAGQTGLKDGARVRLPGDPDEEDVEAKSGQTS